MSGVENEKKGVTWKRTVLLSAGYAEKGYAVLQHSPSRGEEADGRTADEENRKPIQTQEIPNGNGC